MKHYLCRIFFFFFSSFIHASSTAQEGHPLDGTWRGQWGPPGGPMSHLVVVMTWGGDGIGGLVNPGRESVELKTASLNPETWEVRFETTLQAGEEVRITGMLEDIGSYNRTITGAWIQDGIEYPLKLTRE